MHLAGTADDSCCLCMLAYRIVGEYRIVPTIRSLIAGFVIGACYTPRGLNNAYREARRRDLTISFRLILIDKTRDDVMCLHVDHSPIAPAGNFFHGNTRRCERLCYLLRDLTRETSDPCVTLRRVVREQKLKLKCTSPSSPLAPFN